MSNLENNELETMDASPALEATSIKNMPFLNYPDIIAYLSVMESITTNSLKYLNDLYAIEPYELDGTTIAKIGKLERKIFLLETKILETISKDSNCQDKYNEYLNLHRNFMSNVLFSNESDAIIQNVAALNTILEQIPTVADLVQERKEKFEAIAKHDEDNNIAFRYKRIFLRRKFFFYEIIHTKLTVGESFERTNPNRIALAKLLNNQDDFAIYTFYALCKPMPTNKTMLTTPTTKSFDFDIDDNGLDDDEKRKSSKVLIDGNDEERKNEIEKLKADDTSSIASLIGKKETDILALKTKIEEDFEKLGDFNDLLRIPIEEDNTDEKMKELKQLRQIYLNEKDALEILKTLAELKKQGEKPHKDPEKERQQKIVEEWNKYMQQETGAAVGKLLYMVATGKTKNAEKLIESTIINLTKKSAVLFAQFISGPLAPFVGGVVDGFLGLLFEKEKGDPVLKGIGEIKEKLDKIEEKIDGLETQIKAFQAEITRMINGIPDEVVSKIEISNLTTKINDLLSNISTELLNNETFSKKIITNDKKKNTKTSTTKDLIDHSSKVLGLIQDVINKIYGLTSMEIGYYKIPEEPSSTSFIGWHLKNSKEEHYQFHFYDEYKELLLIINNLKEKVFDTYSSIQDTVNKALEIQYAMGKDIEYAETIIEFLTNQKQIKDEQSTMFANLNTSLTSKILGKNNYALFGQMRSYKDNPTQFNFTKAFGLQMSEVKGAGKDAVESWHFCTYNYLTKQFEKIQPDAKSNKAEHITRFFINPGFGRTYNLYYANNDCRQTLIKAKVCLGLDDTINIILEGNKEHQTFRAVPISDPVFENSVDNLFATNGYIVLPDYGETNVQMPLSNFRLHIQASLFEYRISFRKYKPATKDKEEIRGYAEIFVENLDPEKFKGGVILKFDYATLTCSIGTLDSEGKVDPNVSIEVFSFKPKEGLILNQLYATNWKLKSKSGYPLNIDNRYLVSYLNKQLESLADTNAKLAAGQALYKNEEIFTDKYKMKYIGDGNIGFYAYNTIGNAYEECLIKSESFTSNVEVLVMQDNGSLVAYDNNGKNVWQRSGDFDYIEMYSNAKVTAYKNNGQGESIFAGLFLLPKPDLKPAEYLKRGEYIGLVSEYGPHDERIKLLTRMELTKEGDLKILKNFEGSYDIIEDEAITGLNAHYLKMGLDGTLALYDDKKNILKQISAGQGNVKCDFEYRGNTLYRGCFLKNEDKRSRPIKEFWLNEWT